MIYQNKTKGIAGKCQHQQQPSNNPNCFSNVQHEGTSMDQEEILHLRRQLGKLNHRVLNMEINNEKRLQREKIVCCLGLAYFVLKTIFWLNRN